MNGGMSRVRVSSQAMYSGADTEALRGMGSVLGMKGSGSVTQCIMQETNGNNVSILHSNQSKLRDSVPDY